MITRQQSTRDRTGQDGYKIVIHVGREKGGLDGRVRAAREMAAVATRQPGFVGLETEKQGGHVIAFVLHWITLEDIDAWRAKIYDSALQRYGADAWTTFVEMEVEPVPGTKHRLHDSGPIAQALHHAADRVFNGLLPVRKNA
ncbi:MAG: hypothetical protein HQ501_05170 [Rhodospirillales bacterium]|nr:hypothetical protein [Rhodospirillales bacterium]